MTHDEIRMLAHKLDRTEGVDKLAGEVLRELAELLDEAETVTNLLPTLNPRLLPRIGAQLAEMVDRIQSMPPGPYWISVEGPPEEIRSGSVKAMSERG